ncbi:sensor histidine kinase [Paracoccus aestuarii]|uniref:Signal transduction histidine-protein kinase/phosphatase MprB n=1 Tax=Paracoccus aestuarii TaxID=453842 RepID=A0A418ZRR9_9RHOB|nr:HAMP domain-containing sensor histidine kinase [Paracoccus aestuarii]RJK99494.1 sensor histidine kinase [Paracoccus aestuarii]WCR01117.1 HAMP domain-containing histidine kinase [Paracoccus aestuarii]
MTPTRSRRRRSSYVRRLQLAFGALAGLALLMAVLGWHILREAEHRVLRGRIASDVYTSLLLFAEAKAELRNWSYRRVLDQPATAEARDALIDALQGHLGDYAALADLARARDAGRNKPAIEAEARDRILTVLAAVVDRLDAQTGALLPASPLAEGVAIRRIDRQFDSLAEADLPALLDEGLRAERAALDLERLRADEGLADARQLFLAAAGTGAVGSLALALLLVLRLRQPLRRLETGLAAFAAGDFGHRFGGFRDREFVQLGRQLNAMATEVVQNRQRDDEFRSQLEGAVQARTSDLRRALAELAASERARQQLVADIGHELRTPVTVIRGEAQVALRAADADAPRAALGRIVDVTRQMGRLIEDLLVFVRRPDDGMRVDPRPVGLADALDRALGGARSQGAARGVTVAMGAVPAGIRVMADPDRLQQILAALLDNALRYSHPGGAVSVDVATDGGRVRIALRDQGIGITPRDMDHVFTRGWRGRAARRHRPDGLGLGLAIARDLARAQGGGLDLGPNDPRGVVAVLALPLAPDPGAPDPVSSDPGAA